MNIKILKVKNETNSGLNKSFMNENTGRTIEIQQVIAQIKKWNATYDGYHVVKESTVIMLDNILTKIRRIILSEEDCFCQIKIN